MFHLCCVAFSALLIALATAQNDCQGSLTTGVNNIEWYSPMPGYLTINASTTHAVDTWMAIGISFTRSMVKE